MVENLTGSVFLCRASIWRDRWLRCEESHLNRREFRRNGIGKEEKIALSSLHGLDSFLQHVPIEFVMRIGIENRRFFHSTFF
jgi:hypothetical protein